MSALDANLRSGPQMLQYQSLARDLAARRPGRLLDWGCGTGIAARRFLAARGGVERVFLWDHSQAALEFAVEHLRAPDLPVTDRIVREILTLPISAGHTEAEADEVAAAVRQFFKG